MYNYDVDGEDEDGVGDTQPQTHFAKVDVKPKIDKAKKRLMPWGVLSLSRRWALSSGTLALKGSFLSGPPTTSSYARLVYDHL